MIAKPQVKIFLQQNNQEAENRKQFYNLYANSPIPQGEKLLNLGLYVKRQELSRFLFMNELYKKILDRHGIIIEFGVRWGQNLALFQNLRGIYEPFNHTRKIVGFDTFNGFPSVHEKDGPKMDGKQGVYAVTNNYMDHLDRVLGYHETESPVSHIKKYELIKGDACQKITEYLDQHPETIIALAYFDFDIYEPTRKCLEAIQPYLARGSVLAFDELCYSLFPGETLALKETMRLQDIKINRTPYSNTASYMVL